MFGRDEKPSQIRLTVVQYLILAVFLVLAYGLWRLQVSQSDYYSAAAEQNRIRNVPILAPRGRIVDRNGRIIVDNYRSVTALLMRDSSRDLMTDSDEIASGLHMDPKEVKEKIRRFAFTPQYQPIYLKEDITPDEEAFIEAHKLELPELDTIMAYRRLYPLKGFMAHVIGYVGEVSEDMLNQPQFELYNPGDVVGKSGVELEYNGILMGKNGSRQVLVDSHGREVGKPLEEKAAEPGKQLKLTVDVDLQIAAEEALADKNGAVVAMDPHTGEILAMVSRPTFDPNAFAVRISSKEWSKLVNDPDKPLLNRAIQAQLAPGSTFKIIMSVAGWQEGVAQDLNVQCNGGAEFYGRRFGCWVKGGHGPVDLTKAIYQSCDVFFYNLANKLGINRIAQYATSFRPRAEGRVLIFPQEVSGLIPSEEWKLRNFRQKWFAGETISVGIGPRERSRSVPFQLTRAIAAISMDGRLVTPHVADPTWVAFELPRGEPLQRGEERSRWDANGWNLITECNEPRATAGRHRALSSYPGYRYCREKPVRRRWFPLATRAKHQNNEDLAQNGWFVGFTPRRNPDIVVGVLFQGGEHGKLAARLATEVIKSYVDKQRRQPTGLANGKPSTDGNAEIGALWTSPNERGPGETLEVGHLAVALPKKPRPVATSAPGLE
jgi:penicillin-binding protein 2